jgi:hypothetical protein
VPVPSGHANSTPRTPGTPWAEASARLADGEQRGRCAPVLGLHLRPGAAAGARSGARSGAAAAARFDVAAEALLGGGQDGLGPGRPFQTLALAPVPGLAARGELRERRDVRGGRAGSQVERLDDLARIAGGSQAAAGCSARLLRSASAPASAAEVTMQHAMSTQHACEHAACSTP